jgi:hypothetical protein
MLRQRTCEASQARQQLDQLLSELREQICHVLFT